MCPGKMKTYWKLCTFVPLTGLLVIFVYHLSVASGFTKNVIRFELPDSFENKPSYALGRTNRSSTGVADDKYGFVHWDGSLVSQDGCPVLEPIPEPLSKPPYYTEQGTGVRVHDSFNFDTTKFDNTCKTDSPLAAIVPIYSAVGNFRRRTAIRYTIGRTCERLDCKVIFIIGFSKDKTLMQKLKDEYDEFNDILIVGIIDTYRDLNDKAIAMLDWILDHCREARHVIHCVDDTYVNVELFIKELDAHSGSDAIYGRIDTGVPPVRDPTSKYYVNETEYPTSYNMYPDFPIGAAYSFPNTVTKALRCAATKATYIWLEDVWLMGHVRTRAGIRYIQTPHKVEPYEGRLFLEDINSYLFTHPIEPESFYRIYYSMQTPALLSKYGMVYALFMLIFLFIIYSVARLKHIHPIRHHSSVSKQKC